MPDSQQRDVRVRAGSVTLDGTLTVPEGAQGVVLFAHGSGSSRHSPRNRRVAQQLNDGGLATLLIDLLTPEEEVEDARTRHHRFDLRLLAERLVGATDWLVLEPDTRSLSIGYFGSSTGGGAALIAATKRPDVVGAVVSRGGRPDLAGPALARVSTPTLLIVGGEDRAVIELNEQARDQLNTENELTVILGAGHLFEEAGTLDEVARLATAWFRRHLRAPEQQRERGGAGS